MSISIVIPLFNEEDLIDALVSRVLKALDQIDMDGEVVFVNDGSEDQTLEHLLEKREQDSRIKIITFSRNFGHQAAYTAGLHYARSDYVMMMDGDLQDPPELIPEMLNQLLANDIDVLIGQRDTMAETRTRKWLTKLFHWLFESVLQSPTPEKTGNFCLMRRVAVLKLLEFEERVRYLPGLRALVGFNQQTFEYKREERYSGKSVMSIWRLFSLAMDAVFSFSDIPIRICLFIGLIGILICGGGFVYSIASKVFGLAPLGWSSTMTAIFFIGFVQLLFLGVLVEYANRILQGSPEKTSICDQRNRG